MLQGFIKDLQVPLQEAGLLGQGESFQIGKQVSAIPPDRLGSGSPSSSSGEGKSAVLST